MLRKSNQQITIITLITLSLAFLLVCAINANAQTAKAVSAQTQTTATVATVPGEQPQYKEYKGIRIGMKADDVRVKLGEPTDKSEAQDFYIFNEKESAQIFYDAAHQVTALAVNYVGEGSDVPLCKSILGMDVEPKADGTMYKMVRYPKAGYWVSYSRSAGPATVITVTIQKINS